MKAGSIRTLALATLLAAAPAMAQDMPDIGFKSVGRGRPLAGSVNGMPEVGPNWIRQFGQRYDPEHPFPLNGYKHDALPKNYKPVHPFDNGEMVIALLRGTDVTLKKFYRDNGRIRLQPANATMQPLVYDADQVQVQGIVVGVMRKY
mgnify:CR=1 FL=1